MYKTKIRAEGIAVGVGWCVGWRRGVGAGIRQGQGLLSPAVADALASTLCPQPLLLLLLLPH